MHIEKYQINFSKMLYRIIEAGHEVTRALLTA